ncbi:MAG: hypothetical protein HUJ76_05550 [Parasporobacterium sp.]|nr:hypothetical protein [Parasporobacterium sp.]
MEAIEEADVVVADCTQLNDAAEMAIEDAIDFGKKLVVVCNNTDPTSQIMEDADAVIFMTFSRTPDHGTGAGGFITTTEPDVYADILFGTREPEGTILKELARDSAMDERQWKDLAGDQGANSYVRLILEALMETSETMSTPNNYGDPLLQYQYGMRYGQNPEFAYQALIVPQSIETYEEEGSSGVQTVTKVVNAAEAGAPFSVYALLWNNGADGVTTVQVKDGDAVIAEKLMAVTGNSWRVIEMEITLDTPGEHVITLGDLTDTVTVR